jgi:hypothetical protein
MAKKQLPLGWIVAGIILIGLIGIVVWKNNAPGAHDAFASCLQEKGAVFYGAFWCPHCQRQKDMFGRSKRLLPYVECSTPDGQGQTMACTEKGVESYPTWIFADGSRETGEVSLQRLAEKTGCSL